MTKEERIAEIRKGFDKLVEIVADNKKDLIISLFDRAAFMLASVEDLEIYINENGYTETYSNGANQSGKKKSSEAEMYLSLIQRYNQTVAAIGSLLPESEEKKEAGGDLKGFLADNPRMRLRK